MNLPYWLLRLLPLWDYICPKCEKEVRRNSHECPHCHEKYPVPLRVPPKIWRDRKALEDYVHKHVFPKLSQAHRDYLAQYFTTLFTNGFESGDFSAWTGTDSGSATISVESANPHHGTYNSKVIVTAAHGYATSYKTFTATAIGYLRVYSKFSAMPTNNGDRWYLHEIQYNDWQNCVAATLYKTGGAVYWGLSTIIGGSVTDYTEASASNPSPNTWYCIEILRNVTNDIEQIWVNGVSKRQVTVAISNNNNRVEVGITDSANTMTSYHDCVVVADAYIGIEGTLQTVTDSLSISDSVLRNKTLLPITQTISLADAILRNKTLAMVDSVGAADNVLGDKSPLIASDTVALVDALLRNKQFTLTDAVALAELIDVIKGFTLRSVTDSISLSDTVFRDKLFTVLDNFELLDAAFAPSRVLQALDAVGIADGASVSKVLKVTESLSLAEVVEVGASGVKKTRLFLVLGDLAVQLTGD